MLNHVVKDVGLLCDDSTKLMNNVVKDGDSSMDGMISSIDRATNVLKENWKGKDAGVNIGKLIVVRNALSALRNSVSSFAADSSIVASNYRNIQRMNGASVDEYAPIKSDDVANAADYTDNTDTVDINPSVETAVSDLKNVVSSFESFQSNANNVLSSILDNWTQGTGREKAASLRDELTSCVKQAKEVIEAVSARVNEVVGNYNF